VCRSSNCRAQVSSNTAAIGGPTIPNSWKLSIVPIARYFAVVGCVLTGLLLIAGWALPEAPASFPDRPEIERAPIRITSEHKWPEKIVLDTSQPVGLPARSEGVQVQQAIESLSDEIAYEATVDDVAKPNLEAQPINPRRAPARSRRKRRKAPFSHLARARNRREQANSSAGDQCCWSDWAHRPTRKRVAHRDTGIGWPFREAN
jgi:hypothetical protein